MAHISFNTPLGPLTVFEIGDALVAIDWGRAPDSERTPLLGDAERQLQAYFDGRLTEFELPLEPSGTPFQRRVWSYLITIPYGATRTYGQVAEGISSGPRAVASACGRNPLPIVVPCHRVVAAGGALGGYSGWGGAESKRTLLRIEGQCPTLHLISP